MGSMWSSLAFPEQLYAMEIVPEGVTPAVFDMGLDDGRLPFIQANVRH